MPLTRDRALLPERLHGLVINGRAGLDQQDVGEFAVVEPVIEGLEAVDLLPHRLRDGAGPPPGHHLDIRGEEPQHPPLPEAALSVRTVSGWVSVSRARC
jgi:hypothetical protein